MARAEPPMPEPARPRWTYDFIGAPRIVGTEAGLHVLLRLPDRVDDVALAAAAAERGIGVRALSTMSLTGAAERGLLLGYGRLPEERIGGAVAAIATVIGAATGPL